MVPQASLELCAFVLRRCSGDADNALDQLLGMPLEQLAAELESAVRAEKAQAVQVEREARASRRAVLSRYSQQRDYAADGAAAQLQPPRLPYAGTRKQALRGAQKERYRGDEVVSWKGEKHVVEASEDWDGGSRGRVKTKGKRGAGGVGIHH